MESRNVQSRRRYMLSFAIGTIIFISIFGLSYFFSYLQLQRISNLQTSTSYDIFEKKIEYSFFEGDSCPKEAYRDVSESLGFQGRSIEDLERKFGKDDVDVLSQKKFYTLVELEHLEFVNFLNKNCNSTIVPVLFFYSNLGENLDDSERVGRLLSVLYERNEEIIIYSFDVNLDSSLISDLLEKYKVNEPLTIVMKGKNFVNPKNIDELENLLNQ